MGSWEIGPLRPEDAEEAAALSRRCFSQPWSAESFRADAAHPRSIGLSARLDGRLIGFVAASYVLDEGSVSLIGVEPGSRRKGVAQALMERLLAMAWKKGLSFVTLEVRVSNFPAAGLYRKLGFQEAGLRKGFYEKPKEDGLLLTCFRPGLDLERKEPSL